MKSYWSNKFSCSRNGKILASVAVRFSAGCVGIGRVEVGNMPHWFS